MKEGRVQQQPFGAEDAALLSEPDELAATLRKHARRLNVRRRPFLLSFPTYDLMTGGLIWTDEIPFRGPVQLVHALRPLWHFRTGLMFGEHWDGSGYWELGLRMFPHWVGFHPSRRRLTPWRQWLFREGKADTNRICAEVEAACAEDENPEP